MNYTADIWASARGLLDFLAMSEPKIAGREPKAVELTAGKKYFWCACGQSKNQPSCDRSHVGTEFTPVSFTPDATGTAYFCMCKRTGNRPYCDGTHATLDAEPAQIGTKSDAAAAVSASTPRAAPTAAEPTVQAIHDLARDGLSKTGPDGPMVAMGVPRSQLPSWDEIQFVTAQFARQPLLGDVPVKTGLVVGPRARKPLVLDIPLFVSDMSFGALSEEAKVALARGAELAGTGICSGEGGMLPEEQAESSRYLYELGSAEFGFDDSVLSRVQAFHFKGGQGAKTGTGGHLPGNKVIGKIAEVRKLKPGAASISPATFRNLHTPKDFKDFGDRVRSLTGGIPIGMKLSAQHIEDDIDFALESKVDYIILDGRGGGTGAAPAIFRDHISVPTIPALARARAHLDERGHGRDEVTLIITGGLRMPTDFAKAMCLGADGVALANSAIQAVGCVAARMCNTNACPSGVATQDPNLRSRLDVDVGAQRLARFLGASVELMKVLARACGHASLADFAHRDLVTWARDMTCLAGVTYGGVSGVEHPQF